MSVSQSLPTIEFFVCELVCHCGGHRPRLLAGGFTDRHEAQASLEALRDEHPNAYLLPYRSGPYARALTFEEARELHARNAP